MIRAGTGSEGGGHDPSAYRDLGEHRGHAPEACGRFGAGGGEEPERIARYEWNEENRLVKSETGDGIVARYRYDANGIRSTRYSALYGETLYADRMYQENFGANPPALATKHIFVGETRIASKLHYRDQTGGTRALFMERNTYWYHADHLGSTNWVTDHEGEGYEHFQYTPYGESWISEQLGDTVFTMTHRFTGQELDPETGLYAFPARNYDPRTGRWLSVDPAMEEYLPIAPISDRAREHNQNLPGMGGAFNDVNLVVYHYGANNPLRYVNPNGRTNESSDMLDKISSIRSSWLELRETVSDMRIRRSARRGELFTWPLQEGRLTSVFGDRPTIVLSDGRAIGGPHGGIDIANVVGTQIGAAADGRVSRVGKHDILGDYVVIDHGGGYETLYGHLSSVDVLEGQGLSRGDAIGGIGNTGAGTGPHLHFEILRNGVKLDPIQQLPSMPEGILPDDRYIFRAGNGNWRNR